MAKGTAEISGKLIRCHCTVCKGIGAELPAPPRVRTATAIHMLVQVAHSPLGRGERGVQLKAVAAR